MVQETWVQSQVESIPKTQKMLLDASLLNTQNYKVEIKGSEAIQVKEQYPPLRLGVVAIEKGDFASPSTMVNFLLFN